MKNLKRCLSFVFALLLMLNSTLVIASAHDISRSYVANENSYSMDLDVNGQVSSGESNFSINVLDNTSKEKAVTPLLIKVTYAYDSKNKQFDFSFNVDAPTTLIKPKLSSATMTVKKASSKNGTYTTVGTSSTWSNISYITNYKKSIAAATGHYKITVDITPSSGVAVSGGLNTVYWCINRTGHIWVWNYTDSLSGKSMSEPVTNLTKNQIYSRPSNLNTTYKNWYDSTYNTNLSLTNKQVHHIKPLAYGGNNNMSNLIHLDTSFHSNVTAWWAGY